MSDWKVAVCVAHSPDYAPLAELTMPTVKAWCEKHGYTLVYKPDVDPKRGDRVKIELYQQLYLSQQFDTFVWIDTDAAISNSNVTIESFCTQWHDIEGKAHVIFGADPAGLNSGFFVARFSPEAFAYLSESQKRSAEMGWSDQPGMVQMTLLHPYNQWVKVINGKYCNAYPLKYYPGWQMYPDINQWEPGCFILHLPGLPMQRRIEIFTEYMPQFT